MVDQRYFRADPAVYEAVRVQLDALFGYPDGKTETVWVQVAHAPKDASGRCLLAVRAESCNRPHVAALLPQLLESKAVTEITESEYMAALPQPTT